MCEPQRELGRVVVFIYKGNSSAIAESKLLVIGGLGGLTSSLVRYTPYPCTGPITGRVRMTNHTSRIHLPPFLLEKFSTPPL